MLGRVPRCVVHLIRTFYLLAARAVRWVDLERFRGLESVECLSLIRPMHSTCTSEKLEMFNNPVLVNHLAS
jgi:hypothetical protein